MSQRRKPHAPADQRNVRNVEDFMVDKYEKVRQELEKVEWIKRDAACNSKTLATLVAHLTLFMDLNFGAKVPVEQREMTKFPAVLLRDYRPNGALKTILELCFEFKAQQEGAGSRRFDILTEKAKPHVIQLCRQIFDRIKADGHWKPPKVFFWTGQGGVTAEDVERCTALVSKHHGVVVGTIKEATHIVVSDACNPDFNPSDPESYFRTIERMRTDLGKNFNLIHWWYHPDSYDVWVQGSADDEIETPIRPPDGIWKVGMTFITHLETFNEWMNEADYEIIEAHLPPPLLAHLGQASGKRPQPVQTRQKRQKASHAHEGEPPTPSEAPSGKREKRKSRKARDAESVASDDTAGKAAGSMRLRVHKTPPPAREAPGEESERPRGMVTRDSLKPSQGHSRSRVGGVDRVKARKSAPGGRGAEGAEARRPEKKRKVHGGAGILPRVHGPTDLSGGAGMVLDAAGGGVQPMLLLQQQQQPQHLHALRLRCNPSIYHPTKCKVIGRPEGEAPPVLDPETLAQLDYGEVLPEVAAFVREHCKDVRMKAQLPTIIEKATDGMDVDGVVTERFHAPPLPPELCSPSVVSDEVSSASPDGAPLAKRSHARWTQTVTREGGLLVTLPLPPSGPPVPPDLPPPPQNTELNGAEAARPASASEVPVTIQLPSFADWFDTDSVHNIEMQHLGGFFGAYEDGEGLEETKRRYVAVRNAIVERYRMNPRKYLSATECRRFIDGDALLVLQIHSFLDFWGVINFQADPSTLPLKTRKLREDTVPQPAATTTGGPSQPAPARPIGRIGQPQPQPGTQPTMGIHQQGPSAAASASQGGVGWRPGVGAGAGVGGATNVTTLASTGQRYALPKVPEGPPGPKKCVSCGKICLYSFYVVRKTAGAPALSTGVLSRCAWCELCYREGLLPPNLLPSQLRKVTVPLSGSQDGRPDASGTMWTEHETMRLIEGLELYGDSWDEVASHVGNGKTASQCIMHFVALPIEEETPLPPTATAAAGMGIGRERGMDSRSLAAMLTSMRERRDESAVDYMMKQLAGLASVVDPKLVTAAINAALEEARKENLVPPQIEARYRPVMAHPLPPRSHPQIPHQQHTFMHTRAAAVGIGNGPRPPAPPAMMPIAASSAPAAAAAAAAVAVKDKGGDTLMSTTNHNGTTVQQPPSVVASAVSAGVVGAMPVVGLVAAAREDQQARAGGEALLAQQKERIDDKMRQIRASGQGQEQQQQQQGQREVRPDGPGQS
ncbi:unnamed protein product [Vitrella brassicaformis CCMP3155]|uniref:SWIRM domain-containing protein n=4 Tax=Vitrella brassicaformis TaxID=1169539 RepID=A0A0G4F9B5_VITBC|nr:unnamed protein product [Vitrella brassicaformis CCMP3155]|eukprot:CEM09346.1 unnamed protein product [Vitrella brassicaformis CCMP3155]